MFKCKFIVCLVPVELQLVWLSCRCQMQKGNTLLKKIIVVWYFCDRIVNRIIVVGWEVELIMRYTLEMNYHLNKVDSCENSTHRLEHIVR